MAWQQVIMLRKKEEKNKMNIDHFSFTHPKSLDLGNKWSEVLGGAETGDQSELQLQVPRNPPN